MGTMTLQNFRDELTYLLENRTGIGNARFDRWVNRVYEHISYPNVHKHWELETKITVPLVADDFDYDLSTTATYVTREILGVRSARYVAATTDSFTARRQVLQVRSLGWFNRRQHVTNAAGPNYYGIFHKELLVSPGPTSAIAGNAVILEVWEQPAVLSAGGDTTVLLPWWDEVILAGARWLAEAELGFMEYAEQSRQTYISLLREAPNRELVGAEDEETSFPDMETGEPIQMRA